MGERKERITGWGDHFLVEVEETKGSHAEVEVDWKKRKDHRLRWRWIGRNERLTC